MGYAATGGGQLSRVNEAILRQLTCPKFSVKWQRTLDSLLCKAIRTRFTALQNGLELGPALVSEPVASA